MSKVIRREVVYPDPPQRVWVALTDPRALAEWLMPNTFKPVVGHKFIFQHDPKPGCSRLTECEVLECDPPRRLSYTWTAVLSESGKPRLGPMRVSWTLVPLDGGTRLTFEHEGIEKIPWWMGMGMRLGWSIMHKRWIPRVLKNVAPDGTFTPGAIPLHKRAYNAKTIPDTLVR